MRESSYKSWSGPGARRKNQKLAIDQGTLFGGLTLLIVGYIVFRFLYPLLEKGVLW